MKFFRGMIGFCIAGMIVMSVWTPLAENYGIFEVIWQLSLLLVQCGL